MATRTKIDQFVDAIRELQLAENAGRSATFRARIQIGKKLIALKELTAKQDARWAKARDSVGYTEPKAQRLMQVARSPIAELVKSDELAARMPLDLQILASLSRLDKAQLQQALDANWPLDEMNRSEVRDAVNALRHPGFELVAEAPQQPVNDGLAAAARSVPAAALTEKAAALSGNRIAAPARIVAPDAARRDVDLGRPRIAPMETIPATASLKSVSLATKASDADVQPIAGDIVAEAQRVCAWLVANEALLHAAIASPSKEIDELKELADEASIVLFRLCDALPNHETAAA